MIRPLIVYKETLSYFPFSLWGYPTLPPRPFRGNLPKKHTVEYMETGKDCCGCFYEEDATLQQHGSYSSYSKNVRCKGTGH